MTGKGQRNPYLKRRRFLAALGMTRGGVSNPLRGKVRAVHWAGCIGWNAPCPGAYDSWHERMGTKIWLPPLCISAILLIEGAQPGEGVRGPASYPTIRRPWPVVHKVLRQYVYLYVYIQAGILVILPIQRSRNFRRESYATYNQRAAAHRHFDDGRPRRSRSTCSTLQQQ